MNCIRKSINLRQRKDSVTSGLISLHFRFVVLESLTDSFLYPFVLNSLFLSKEFVIAIGRSSTSSFDFVSYGKEHEGIMLNHDGNYMLNYDKFSILPLYVSRINFVLASTFTTNFFSPISSSCRRRIALRAASGLLNSQKPKAAIEQ